MQQMENLEIYGAKYQQGERAGYEIRKYLLNKWRRTCAYCGAKDMPLQREHIHPKAMEGATASVIWLWLAVLATTKRGPGIVANFCPVIRNGWNKQWRRLSIR
jgi:hypothetical protein